MNNPAMNPLRNLDISWFLFSVLGLGCYPSNNRHGYFADSIEGPMHFEG